MGGSFRSGRTRRYVPVVWNRGRLHTNPPRPAFWWRVGLLATLLNRVRASGWPPGAVIPAGRAGRVVVAWAMWFVSAHPAAGSSAATRRAHGSRADDAVRRRARYRAARQHPRGGARQGGLGPLALHLGRGAARRPHHHRGRHRAARRRRAPGRAHHPDTGGPPRRRRLTSRPRPPYTLRWPAKGDVGGQSMRLVTIRTANGTRAGRVQDDRVIDLAAADLATLVPRPSKVICLGLNYASHIQEMGRELPKYPTLFAKFPGTLIGAYDPILLPRVSEQVDWEVELGVVIGRPARHVSGDEAIAAIAGYTVVNDVSVRDYQTHTNQFLAGKIFERTTPVGPALVTLDELPGGGADLAVRCEVDGQVMQHSRTFDLLFGPAEIIAYVSEIITLEPGDLIATGTPAGVGAARTPPVWLRPRQVVRTVVEGVGECVNRCVPEPAAG